MKTLPFDVLLLSGEWVRLVVEETAPKTEGAPSRYKVGAGTRYAVGPTPEITLQRYADRVHWKLVGAVAADDDRERPPLEAKRQRMLAQQQSNVAELFRSGAAWPRADEVRLPRTLDEADAAVALADTALRVQPLPGTADADTEARRALSSTVGNEACGADSPARKTSRGRQGHERRPG